MSLQLGDTAPDFTAETTEGRINFYEFTIVKSISAYNC